MGSAEFDAEMAQIRARRDAARDAMRGAFERSPAVLVIEGDLEELWILSGETDPRQGRVRISQFGRDGPRTHLSDQSLDELVAELAATWATYEPVDEAFAMEWTSTPEWTEGQLRVAYVQAFNRLQFVGGKHGASDWAWEQISQARQLDVEEATRVLERAASDLEAGRAPNDVRSLKARLTAR